MNFVLWEMEFAATIDGGTKTVGSGLSGQMQYFGSSKSNAKQIKFAALRVGEIVFGRISSILQCEIAYVKLPIGTFSAIIHKGIRQGDELYFKVEEVSPDLILKVHSVSIANNNRNLNINEIIRILDLPFEDIFYDIIDNMRKDNSQIVKNDVLLILKSIYNIIPNFDKNTSIDELIKVCIFLNQIKVEPDLSIVRSLIPTISGGKKIDELLNKFIELSNRLPYNSKHRLSLLFNFSDEKYINLEKSFRLFSNSKKYDNLNNICQKIISISTNNNNFIQLQKISKQILSILESQSFWNHLAYEAGKKLQIFHAIKLDNQIYFANISLQLTKTKKESPSTKNLANNNHEFDLYEILVDKFKNIMLFVDSFSNIEEYALEIKSLFNTLGIELISFYMFDEVGVEYDLILPDNQVLNTKFSVVV